MPWLRIEDCSLGELVVELTPTTVSVFHWHNDDGPRLHLGLLSVSAGAPDRKGRRDVRFAARPGPVGAGFRLRVAEADWPRVEHFLALVASAQRELEPPVA